MIGDTPRGDRLRIVLFGRRNAGKSSLLNALCGQPLSIVSSVPGTTTDAVSKALEIRPLGPVLVTDTAGLDDDGSPLGQQRVERSRKILETADLAVLALPSDAKTTEREEAWVKAVKERGTPLVVARTKTDLTASPACEAMATQWNAIGVCSPSGEGIDTLRSALLEASPKDWEPPFLADLVRPGEFVVMVVPVDLGAPKGRLIMPQVKAIRDCLDADAVPVVCKEHELPAMLARLGVAPGLVVCDSQVVDRASSAVPRNIPFTTFSILSMRQKGDLSTMVDGLGIVDNLRPGDRVLIAESCAHHPQEDDIGRVKIPRWLDSHVGGALHYTVFPGCAYPDDLAGYALVVHCGACTMTRREMLRRQEGPRAIGVPMTNYGLLISHMKGQLPRVLEPFQGRAA
jgi:[FeFe] hydrogenase H-cluster maturation GTPase HydF